MVSQPQKFLFLSAHTGNGHNAAAAAVAQAVCQQGHRVEIAHPIEESHRFNRWIAGTYDWALQHYPRRMHWYFEAVNRIRPDRQLFRLNSVRAKGLAVLRQYQPDMVVSFHPMLNHPFARLCRQMQPPIPVACVVTDPFPPFWEGWICPHIDRFFVATPEAAAELEAGGVAAPSISETGLPVQTAFEKAVGISRDWRLQNGLDPEMFTLLLNAGWLGSDDCLELYRALGNARLPIQVVYIHGRTHEARAARLAKRSAVQTVLMPRTEQMARWMQACDLMASKPGALTVFEAFASGLPVAVNALSPVMPQESGLAEAIRTRGLGFWIRTPVELVETIRRLLQRPAELVEIRANVRRFYKAGAARRIARSILEMSGAVSVQTHRQYLELPPCGLAAH